MLHRIVLYFESQVQQAHLYLKGEMECAVMGQRCHRGFTAAVKTELWDRWKRGESLKAIGRAFGKPSSSIYFLVAPQGGIRPAQRRRSRMARMTYLGPRRFDRQGFAEP